MMSNAKKTPAQSPGRWYVHAFAATDFATIPNTAIVVPSRVPAALDIAPQ
jgi:hypothetical protein